MHLTEMLITGFDGDEPVFAVNLTSTNVITDSTGAEGNGETAASETSQHATNAFEAIYGILDRLPKISVAATSRPLPAAAQRPVAGRA